MWLHVEMRPWKRWLSYTLALRGPKYNRTGVLIRRGRPHTKERPCEDTVRDKGPQEKPNLPTSWSWASKLMNSRKISFCCVSHPAFGILLRQPEQTSAGFLQQQQHLGFVANVISWDPHNQKLWESGPAIWVLASLQVILILALVWEPRPYTFMSKFPGERTLIYSIRWQHER